MEPRFDESNDFMESGEAESWDGESFDEAYDVEAESWDAEGSSRKRRHPHPVRRPSVLRPSPTSPSRGAAGYLRTPRGTAQIVVPAVSSLRGGVNQLQTRQDRDRTELTDMLRRFQAGNERRFKRQAVASALAAVAPLAIQLFVSRFSK